MDTLIRGLESIPVSLEAIKRIGLPSSIAVVLYKNLTAKHLQKDAVIILLENPEQKIGHFVTVVAGKEYFDSYGKPPEYAIKKTQNDDKLLQLLPRKYIRNRTRLQRESSDINTCGLFAIARALFSHLSQSDFLSLFKRKTHLRTADDTITIMTLLLRKIMDLK